jgi:hypothetical protein
MSEDRTRTGNASPTRQCKIETTAHAVAMYGSNCRGRKARHRVHQASAQVCEVKGSGTCQRGNLIEIGTCGKEVSITSYNEKRGRMRREFI